MRQNFGPKTGPNKKTLQKQFDYLHVPLFMLFMLKLNDIVLNLSFICPGNYKQQVHIILNTYNILFINLHKEPTD